jgi:hypothetical protein
MNIQSANNLIDEIKYNQGGESLFPLGNSISQRIEKTKANFPKLAVPCEDVIQSMQNMTSQLRSNIYASWGQRELPPFQQFVSIYFSRNVTYLQSAYLLASASLCGPSRDLQRTVFETIIRGYLFIVEHKEADLMYNYIENKIRIEALQLLRKRNFWPFEFMIQRLYTPAVRKKHRNLFDHLSYFSHPSIRGAFKDLDYASPEVEDCLNCTLAFAYGNIQMLSEGFSDFLKPSLNKTISDTMFEIADTQGEIGSFEPDLKQWEKKIKFKKGNFLALLR